MPRGRLNEEISNFVYPKTLKEIIANALPLFSSEGIGSTYKKINRPSAFKNINISSVSENTITRGAFDAKIVIFRGTSFMIFPKALDILIC